MFAGNTIKVMILNISFKDDKYSSTHIYNYRGICT